MTEELEAIRATTAQICTVAGTAGPPDVPEEWHPQVWKALAEAGFTLLPVPAELGGSGAGVAETAAVLREVARAAVGVPVAETALLAGWLLTEARLPVPQGPLTAALATGVSVRRTEGGYLLAGSVPRVPYGHVAERVVLAVTGDHPLVLSLEARGLPWARGRNLAGEPRDSLELDSVFVPDVDTREVDRHVDRDAFTERGALARSVGMAGSMEATVAASVAYAREREQFGRPIARFQAVQQMLARMAAELAATNAAVEAATDVPVGRSPDRLLVAAAKVQAGRSASIVSRLAHQTHGAMGFTQEHALHRTTTRLWSWRDEFGSEQYWSKVLGEAALGSDDLWQLVSGPGRRSEHG